MIGADYVFPGGETRISASQNRELCAAVHATPAEDGTAHPGWAYIATQAGMGLSVDALLALCAFDAKDGPLLGSSDTQYLQPLRTDRTYAVSGRVESFERKHSKKLGAMDVLRYTLALSEESGPVVEVTNTWILPRRDAHAI